MADDTVVDQTPDQTTDQTPPDPSQGPTPAQMQLYNVEGMANAGTPVQTIPQPEPMLTAPTVPQLNIDPHLHGLHRALDVVANLMAPTDTYHVSKDDQGNITVDKSPSSTGEKWGRIAAAALSGAATGLSQVGVNAGARAVGAGFQGGIQIAQEGKTEAEREAQLQQQIQLRNAQNALVHQEMIAREFANKVAPQVRSEEHTNYLLGLRDKLDSLGAQYQGSFDDHQGMVDLHNGNPALINHHVGLHGHMLTIPSADGPGVDTYSIPTNVANERLTEPMKAPDIIHLKDDGSTYTTPGQTFPVGYKKIDAMNQIQGLLNNNDKTIGIGSQIKQRLNPEGKPGTAYQVTSMRTGQPYQVIPMGPGKPPDIQPLNLPGGGPVARMGTTTAAGGDFETPGGGGRGPTGPTTPAEMASPTGGELGDEGRFLNQFTIQPSAQGQTILDNLPTGQANLVRRFGNYLADESKELPRGKERGPFLDLVSSVYPNFSSSAYTARAKLLNSIAGDGKIAQTRNALNLAIQHMGEMYTDMQAVDPGEYPLANKGNRTWHLSAGFGDKNVKAAYGGYNDANEMVASEIARVFKGGAPTQGEISEFRGHSDITDPRSAQEGSFATRAHMLASRMTILNRQLQEGFNTPNNNYQLLTPESIQTLHKLPGGDEVLRRAGVPVNAKPATTTPPAATAPATTPPPAGIGEGTIIKNPQTGERQQWSNGQWRTLNR